MKNLLFLLLLLSCMSPTISSAQRDTIVVKGVRKERWIANAGLHTGLWLGSLLTLNKVWYTEFDRTDFHTFNDNAEWNQMDKAGHTWSAYGLSRISAATWRWAGLNNRSSAILGGTTGILYQSLIELQDAYSAEWGFSWGDMGANAFGSALFTFQQLQWKQQRIQVKLSYYPSRYPSALQPRADEIFGNIFPERFLKDYNSQTYWLSVNLRDFATASSLPPWLNVAVGYSAANMFGARGNSWMNEENIPFDFTSYPRLRQFYLSPDIDFTKIPTRKKWVRSVLFVLNGIKFPAPAIELNSKGKLKGYFFKF